jgi:hypothetical protein
MTELFFHPCDSPRVAVAASIATATHLSRSGGRCRPLAYARLHLQAMRSQQGRSSALAHSHNVICFHQMCATSRSIPCGGRAQAALDGVLSNSALSQAAISRPDDYQPRPLTRQPSGSLRDNLLASHVLLKRGTVPLGDDV